MNNKVVVGLSGGVDSSVALYLLKKQGYDCIGVNVRMWDENGGGKSGGNGADESGNGVFGEADSAKTVAEQFCIPYYTEDFSCRFKEKVQDSFTDAYISGNTPNPCTVCNRYVKFEALLEAANRLGADYIATGHYARIIKLDNGRYTLMKTPTEVKDQTYALYALSQEQLSRTLMPLGEYTKDEIRNIAKAAGIKTADKPDSQEICFIPDNDYAGFIKNYKDGYECAPGNFVDKNGNILGKHKGIIHYTIGQRKGLGLSFGYPVFVTEIRPKTNEVVLGTNEDVFSDALYAGDINFMGIPEVPKGGIDLPNGLAKIRYAHAGGRCIVTEEQPGILKFVFDKPQRAVTPGQAVVLYDGNKVLLGGTILRQGVN